MPRFARCFGLLALCTLTNVALAVAPEVRDEGKFFSADVVKRADMLIREISRKYDRDLVVETFAAPPADQAAKFKTLNTVERRKLFVQWAKDRANHRVVNGLYILMCKEPQELVVGLVGKSPAPLTSPLRVRLEEKLKVEFAQKRFDEGLLAGILMTQDFLENPK